MGFNLDSQAHRPYVIEKNGSVAEPGMASALKTEGAYESRHGSSNLSASAFARVPALSSKQDTVGGLRGFESCHEHRCNQTDTGYSTTTGR